MKAKFAVIGVKLLCGIKSHVYVASYQTQAKANSKRNRLKGKYLFHDVVVMPRHPDWSWGNTQAHAEQFIKYIRQ